MIYATTAGLRPETKDAELISLFFLVVIIPIVQAQGRQKEMFNLLDLKKVM